VDITRSPIEQHDRQNANHQNQELHNQYLILMERQEQQMGVGFTVTPLMRG
jgi:hypothetical protein